MTSHLSALRATLAAAAIAILAGCTQPTPLPITPASEAKDAPVARRPLEPPVAMTAPTPESPAAAVPSVAAPSPLVVPAGTLYVCVSMLGSQQTQTAIEFGSKVAALCSRHPEMGPCQYERDLCRNSGGRVFAASGIEITRQIEDEYDRKVMRVRFRAN